MTGRDDKLQSVLVLAQDGRTAPLRILTASAASQIQDKPLLQLLPLILVVEARLLLLPLIHLNLKSQRYSLQTPVKKLGRQGQHLGGVRARRGRTRNRLLLELMVGGGEMEVGEVAAQGVVAG